jgi:hypothetical protein
MGTIDLTFLLATNLSWSAKGVFCWLMTQPPGALVVDAAEVSKDPEELKAALKELAALNALVLRDEGTMGFPGGGKIHEA